MARDLEYARIQVGIVHIHTNMVIIVIVQYLHSLCKYMRYFWTLFFLLSVSVARKKNKKTKTTKTTYK